MIKSLPQRVYLDTNILIYLIEGHPEFHGAVLSLFSEANQQGTRLVVSDLCQCECLMGAHKIQDQDLVRAYEGFFYRCGPLFEIASLKRRCLRNGARSGR